MNTPTTSAKATLLRSRALAGDVYGYTQGECHVLALALHRRFGWKMEVICEDGNVWWQDKKDASRFQLVPIHVYAVDHDGMFWDIRGVRGRAAVAKEMKNFFKIGDRARPHLCNNEKELSVYVDGMGKDKAATSRPLNRFSEEDVELSWGVATQVFRNIPAFAKALEALKPSKRKVRKFP